MFDQLLLHVLPWIGALVVVVLLLMFLADSGAPPSGPTAAPVT